MALAAESSTEPGARRATFLGVEVSVLGKRWEERLGDPGLGLALAQRLSLPEIVGRVLAGRGVGIEAAASFLAPTLRDFLPDPAQFKDMDKAVARLMAAITKGESLAVFGDYDVDGATSSALLKRFFQAIGVSLRIYIPDRMVEGYGPNTAALLRLKDEGVSVVITVDCGVTAFEPLAAAAEAGLDVIVVDHHAAEAGLPRATAVVNPNRRDDTSNQGQLAAVGVTYLLVVALNRALRQAGWYKDKDRTEPDLLQWLDLVALGTVCDVVPLTGVNRALVTQGLKIMAGQGNLGLAALGAVASLDGPPTTYHAGYLLGPRVNAGGRVGEAGLGARLLSSEDAAEAADIARRLDAYNVERRAIEADVLAQAIAQVEDSVGDGTGDQEALVFAAAEGWHPGVIGIVASRLKERYNRPALVIALAENIGKGSGRSVSGVDLGAAVIAARQAGLLINGGGHAMAAGLTVEADKLTSLRSYLSQHLTAQLEDSDNLPTLGFDGALQPAAATAALLAQLERCGPFGAGNAQPRFVLPSARVVKADVVGKDHVRCILTGPSGGRLKSIAFGALDTPLGQALLRRGGLPIHIAGKLRPDSWAGPKAVQFIIEDAATIQG